MFRVGSSVGIANGYGLGGPEIESRLGQDFPHMSRLTLGPTQARVCVDSEMNLVMFCMPSCTLLLDSFCQCLVVCSHSVNLYLIAY
jgi:hypothetical protein